MMIKKNLSDFENSNYFQLAKTFIIVHNNKKIFLTVFFNGEANEIIDSDNNSQTCQIVPNLQYVYVYDMANKIDYTNKLTKEQKNRIIEKIKSICDDVSQSACQEDNPYDDIIPVGDIKDKFTLQNIKIKDENNLSNWDNSYDAVEFYSKKANDFFELKCLKREIEELQKECSRYTKRIDYIKSDIQRFKNLINKQKLQLNNTTNQLQIKYIKSDIEIDNQRLKQKQLQLSNVIKYYSNNYNQNLEKLNNLKEQYNKQNTQLIKKYQQLQKTLKN